MNKPVVQGIVNDISESPKHKPTYKKTLWEVIVDNKPYTFYGDITFKVGDTVAVWKNDKNGRINYNITLAKGGSNSSASQTNNTTNNAAPDNRQASIVAQNALNRGMDAVAIYSANVRAAIEHNIAGVQKAQLKTLCDLDFIKNIAKEIGNDFHHMLMSGDLSEELPKFDGEQNEASE